MFIENCWYVAAWSEELGAASQIIARTIAGYGVVLYRSSQNNVVALEDRCCHRLAPLSKGRLEGDSIRCGYHGFRFASDGKCDDIPGQKAIPPAARVKRYAVIERDGWIWLWLGDSTEADVALIPALSQMNDRGFIRRTGFMDYQANYQLINDNLTDFSHLSFVHRDSFVIGDAPSTTRPAIARIERGLRIERWIEDKSALTGRRPDKMSGIFDKWHSYDYLVPGILLMLSKTYPSGTAIACNNQPPSPELTPIATQYSAQAVTPITLSTSRYFYSFGLPASSSSEERAIMYLGVLQKAFAEDREMIEAQQKNIDACADKTMLLSSVDFGPTQMRRLIDKLIEADSAAIALSAELAVAEPSAN